MNANEIGATIARYRKGLKKSMREVAADGGVSPTTWSDLERGKHPPVPATQRAVAKALGWRIDWYDVLADTSGEPIWEVLEFSPEAEAAAEARADAIMALEIPERAARTLDAMEVALNALIDLQELAEAHPEHPQAYGYLATGSRRLARQFMRFARVLDLDLDFGDGPALAARVEQLEQRMAELASGVRGELLDVGESIDRLDSATRAARPGDASKR